MILDYQSANVTVVNQVAAFFECRDAKVVHVRLTGTYSARLIPQISQNGTNWVAISGYDANGASIWSLGGDTAASMTSGGVFNVMGARYFRLICDIFVSGQVDVVAIIGSDYIPDVRNFAPIARQSVLFTSLNAAAFWMSNAYKAQGLRGLFLQLKYTAPVAPVVINAVLYGAVSETASVSNQIPLGLVTATTLATAGASHWLELGFVNQESSAILAASQMGGAVAAQVAYGNLTDANGVAINWSVPIDVARSVVAVPFTHNFLRLVVFNADVANNLAVSTSRISTMS